ncbi:unnamed protein product [Mycetohabitans rhizoxinica HKI 454]|uniref:Uncharacterized protein n=1 Tax=Mycetohabitans rhizoxinica (strain DSM 19002 / CIP 109453 / HKI 454) TaxID=882378 RepID=E5AQS1_MYCRK|nr:unnamed protein product [Mycetohabitans rhizoxinica HKI 454]
MTDTLRSARVAGRIAFTDTTRACSGHETAACFSAFRATGCYSRGRPPSLGGLRRCYRYADPTARSIARLARETFIYFYLQRPFSPALIVESKQQTPPRSALGNNNEREGPDRLRHSAMVNRRGRCRRMVGQRLPQRRCSRARQPSRARRAQRVHARGVDSAGTARRSAQRYRKQRAGPAQCAGLAQSTARAGTTSPLKPGGNA